MAENEDEVKAAGEPGREASDGIREEIDRTRMELDETVDAIGAKLKPGRIAQEGWEAVKSSSEQGANRLVRIAREHPIPMGLIGVGLTWLVVERRRRSSREEWVGRGEGEDYSDFAGEGTYEPSGAREKARGAVSGAKDAIGSAAGRVSDSATSAARRVAEVASQAGSKVGQVASQAGSKVGQMAGSVKDRAVDLGQRTTEQVRRARDGYWEMVDRRPMAVGVATMAAGVLIGLLIPTTRREHKLMGETRDQLLRGAKEAGRQTFEKTKEVARSAVDAAQDAAQSEAHRQNLSL